MQNVQIAIPDRIYAEALRDLLMADGQHRVFLVDYPSPAIGGVMVVGSFVGGRPISPAGCDFDRCVVFTGTTALDMNQLWEAGVRHVIHADCPPDTGRLVVLAAERRLGSGAPRGQKPPIFDETDKLFLQSLRISD
jgi:hypothetical protein